MAQVELIMPKMGESVAEATIIKWVKNIGDQIDLDESVLEIATDKVDSEVPSPISGKLIKQLFKENDVVPVGAAVAIIETDANAIASAPASSAPKAEEIPGIKEVEVAPAKAAPVESPSTPAPSAAASPSKLPANDGIKFYSPLVRSIAAEEGISQTELDGIQGTGNDGRVTKQDILNFVKNRGNGSVASVASTNNTQETKATSNHVAAPVASNVSLGGSDEIIEMDRMRKLIADHMVMSKQTSPHVTSFVEADVTNLVMWREKVKKTFEKNYGEKITYTPILIQAVAKAIADFPMINVQVKGNQIIVKKNINIGMATALPTGNLIVPVIKNANHLNLVGVTKAVNDLAGRARIGKLSPDDIQGGTYTVSNVGTFGNVMGTPIINQPQVAILAFGAIRKRPAVIETEFGDVIAIRHMMFLSHSYDHRVVDGALGGMFVKRVAEYLEKFDINTQV